MININYNSNNDIKSPTLVLCNRNKHKLGVLYPITEFNITPDIQMINEFSFKINKYADMVLCHLWDKIKDLKLIYVPEWEEYFEIEVSVSDEDETIKTVIGKNLGIAELSQTILYDVEINTEDDIARDGYEETILYNADNPNASLLHRILSKAPHYSIYHVDASIASIVRSFSIDGTSIYDFLSSDLAEEINCIALVNSNTRSIGLYDLENYCNDCHKRYEGVKKICPHCGSTNVKMGYGEDTSIFISKDNLASSVTLETNKDEIKNTFRVQGGDDDITAAVAACNPNGTNYINYFSEDMKDDMSSGLRTKLSDYDTLYNSKLTSYKNAMANIYNAIDQILYLTSEMMPSIETDTNTVDTELAKLTASAIGNISVQKLSTAGKTTVDNAVKGVAEIFMDSGFKVEIYSSSYNSSTHVWSGKFKVINESDEEIYAINTSNIVLSVDDDYENFIQQKIKKILAKQGLNDEIIYDWTLYGLVPLSTYSDAYQNCIDLLIEQGIGNSSNEFYSSLYLKYYNKKLDVDAQIKIRETQISAQETIRDTNTTIKNDIQSELNLENYLGETLWNEYCAFRREDTYQNDNYISDGLNNSELFKKAEELLEVAQKEIQKACEVQYTLSATIGNLLSMSEFKPLINKFKVGNWLRLKVDDEIFKLRLVDYTLNFDSISDIQVTFSSAIKIADDITDIKSVISSAKSMSSSYESVYRQSKKNEDTTITVKDWIDKGLDATTVAINNNSTQTVTFDNHGLLCRSYDEITNTYSDEQLKLVNNTLAITDTNWKSIRTALGKFYYINPENTNETLSAYGVLGDAIVGKILLGETLGIYNNANTLKFDKNGLNITNGTHTFEVNPNDDSKLISISNTTEDIFRVNSDGSGYFKGKVYATSGEFTGKITATSLSLGSNVSISSNKIDGLSIVATSGKYSDLSNTPSIPTSVSDLSDSDNILYKGDVSVSTSTADNIVTETITVPLSDGTTKTYTIKTSADGNYVLSNVGMGNDEANNDYFCVSTNGLLKARNAIIYGTVYASDGEFTGKVTANSGSFTGKVTADSLTANTSGSIAGWNITSSSLYKTSNVWGNANGMYFGDNGISIKDKFKVNASGKVVASDFEMTGGNISLNPDGHDTSFITATCGDYYAKMSAYGIEANKYIAYASSSYYTKLLCKLNSDGITFAKETRSGYWTVIDNYITIKSNGCNFGSENNQYPVSIEGSLSTTGIISCNEGKAVIYSNDNTVACLQGKDNCLEVAALGTAYAIPWTVSDTKLKKNIMTTNQTALDKVNDIDFVSFDWKHNNEHETLGITANQLETVIPDAVTPVIQPENSEYDSILNVNSYKLTIYALKAIQELSAKIDIQR